MLFWRLLVWGKKGECLRTWRTLGCPNSVWNVPKRVGLLNKAGFTAEQSRAIGQEQVMPNSHKYYEKSFKRQSDYGPTDRLTDRQTDRQSRLHATKKGELHIHYRWYHICHQFDSHVHASDQPGLGRFKWNQKEFYFLNSMDDFSICIGYWKNKHREGATMRLVV